MRLYGSVAKTAGCMAKTVRLSTTKAQLVGRLALFAHRGIITLMCVTMVGSRLYSIPPPNPPSPLHSRLRLASHLFKADPPCIHLNSLLPKR